MRLLLANPNTTAAVTERVAAVARAAARPDTEIVPVTARFGAAVIGSRAEMAVAEHATLELLARHAEGCDAAIIAASTDSGLRAAREVLAIPVLGLTESALHVACLLGGRFGTVTLSRRSGALLGELIELYGLTTRCAAQRYAQATPQALLAEPEVVAGMVALESRRLVDDGADCVVLVGAVMADLPARLQDRVPVPLIEGVSCSVGLAELLVRMGPRKARAGSYAAPGSRLTRSLDPALAALLLGEPP